MKILIDGDNCNNIKTIERIAKEFNIGCHIYANYCRNVESDYSEIHIVDCTRDAADFAIINNCNVGDIIITNDSGLAAMVLSKNGIPIKTNGMEFTKSNIMRYLNSRYMTEKEKRRTNRDQIRRQKMTPDKFTTHPKFCVTLLKIISRCQELS